MKFFICLIFIILPTLIIGTGMDSNDDVGLIKQRMARNILGVKNPIKAFGKCISDHECKMHEYCDHSGINPFGSCKTGKDNNNTCVFDRHCRSKQCHLLKCVGRKPVKDGICSKEQHSECIPEQYCHHEKKDIYNCKDRKSSGWCSKDVHCLSNSCSLARCKKPKNPCK